MHIFKIVLFIQVLNQCFNSGQILNLLNLLTTRKFVSQPNINRTQKRKTQSWQSVSGRTAKKTNNLSSEARTAPRNDCFKIGFLYLNCFASGRSHSHLCAPFLIVCLYLLQFLVHFKLAGPSSNWANCLALLLLLLFLEHFSLLLLLSLLQH